MELLPLLVEEGIMMEVGVAVAHLLLVEMELSVEVELVGQEQHRL